MAISTHTNEYDDVDSFLGDAVTRISDSDAARKFLHERYPDDTEPEDDTAFDMDKAKNDPGFVIEVDDNSFDDFYEQNFLTIHLPNKDDAEEFASIVGGEVVTKKEPGKFFLSGFHHFEDGDEIVEDPHIYDSREDAADAVADIVNDTIRECNSDQDKVTRDDCLDGYTFENGNEKLCIRVIKEK